MKYRDILKTRKSKNYHQITDINTLWSERSYFYLNDIRWMYLCNQWIRSGKKYVMNQVLRKSQLFLRSEYLLSPWVTYRSSLWGSRLFLDVKTKSFGRKQMFFPIVVRGDTSYTRPMLHLRKQMNTQNLPGMFWMKWTQVMLSTSLGKGPIFSTIENKYIQLAKLQNLWEKKEAVSLGKLEWNI